MDLASYVQDIEQVKTIHMSKLQRLRAKGLL